MKQQLYLVYRFFRAVLYTSLISYFVNKGLFEVGHSIITHQQEWVIWLPFSAMIIIYTVFAVLWFDLSDAVKDSEKYK